MLPKLALAGAVTACQGGKLQMQSYNRKRETDSPFPLGVSQVEQNRCSASISLLPHKALHPKLGKMLSEAASK